MTEELRIIVAIIIFAIWIIALTMNIITHIKDEKASMKRIEADNKAIESYNACVEELTKQNRLLKEQNEMILQRSLKVNKTADTSKPLMH